MVYRESERATLTATYNQQADMLRNQLSQREKSLNAKESEMQRLQVELATIIADRESARQELRLGEQSRQNLQELLDDARTTAERLKRALEISEQSRAEERTKTERLAQLDQEKLGLVERVRKIDEENQCLINENMTLKQTVAQSKSSQKHLKSQKAELEKDLWRYREMETQLKNITAELEDVKAAREDLVMTLDLVNKDRGDQEEHLNRLKLERDELDSELKKEKENLRKLNLHFAKRVLQMPHNSDNMQSNVHKQERRSHMTENTSPEVLIDTRGEEELTIAEQKPEASSDMKRHSTRIKSGEWKPQSRWGSSEGGSFRKKQSVNAFNIGRCSSKNVRSTHVRSSL